MEKKEIELVDYLNIIWKRKWVIIIGTISCMVAAGIVSFILPPIYEVDAIIQPGKFLVQDQQGSFEEVVVEDPQQIADKVQHRSYDALIAIEMGVDLKKMPEIKAEYFKDTLLTRIWVRNHDIESCKKILNFLILFLKEEMDGKIGVEIYNLDAVIKENEIEKQRRKEEIEILKEKLKIIAQRKKDIQTEMKLAKNKISILEAEQLKNLKKENRTEWESLGMLLYSNEIQQSLMYNDQLNEKLSAERIKEGNVNSALQVENANINKINNTITNLKEKKGRMDYTKVIKTPTSTIDPVSPNVKLNVVIAFLLGMSSFTVLSFLLEYIEKKG